MPHIVLRQPITLRIALSTSIALNFVHTTHSTKISQKRRSTIVRRVVDEKVTVPRFRRSTALNVVLVHIVVIIQVIAEVIVIVIVIVVVVVVVVIF
jgi:hypothetical protein